MRTLAVGFVLIASLGCASAPFRRARSGRGERSPRTRAVSTPARCSTASTAVSSSASYPIHVRTFSDDLAMVFLAGEVVADYWLRLKRELDGSRLRVNAYTNDLAFYVASRRMIPEGGYEVERSMVYYGQPAALAPETEEEIVRTVLDVVPRAFSRRR